MGPGCSFRITVGFVHVDTGPGEVPRMEGPLGVDVAASACIWFAALVLQSRDLACAHAQDPNLALMVR